VPCANVVLYRGTVDLLQHLLSGAMTGPPLSSWFTLDSLLCAADLRGRRVLLNANDGVLVPGKYLGWPLGTAVVTSGEGAEQPGDFSGEPVDVVQMVGAGWIWVDRCEVPLSRRYIPGFRVQCIDNCNGSGFYAAVEAMGAGPLLGPGADGGPTFNAGPLGGLEGGIQSLGLGKTYPYQGGLLTTSTLPGPVIWSALELWDALSMGALPTDMIPGYKIVDGQEFIAHPIVGVLYGNGAYVWAFADDAGGARVSSSSIAAFIQALLTPDILNRAGAPQTVEPPGAQAPGRLVHEMQGQKNWWSRQPWYVKLAMVGAGTLVVGGGLVFWADLEIHRAGATQVIIEQLPAPGGR